MFNQHDSDQAIYLEYHGDKNDNRVPDPEEIGIKNLKGDGDFRNPESIELLKKVDIVVTNPPFSLFREYVAQLVEHDKQFLIIGDQNAITYKEIFTLIRDNKVWLGYDNGGAKWFQVPDDYHIKTKARMKIEKGIKYISKGSITWYTNLNTTKRHEDLILYKNYSSERYPKYDNYEAVNVDKVAEIPTDYAGMMGVPITFIGKYNPSQFEILNCNDIRLNEKIPFKQHGLIKDKDGAINGKPTYVRIVIKNRDPQKKS